MVDKPRSQEPIDGGIRSQRDGTALTLSVRQAATLLGCGRDAMYALVKRGEIPAIRFGRKIRIPRKAIAVWVESQAQLTSSGTRQGQQEMADGHRDLDR